MLPHKKSNTMHRQKQRRRSAHLISTFVYATWILQFICYSNPRFQASSLLLRLYRPVCVGPGRKPTLFVFSCGGLYVACTSEYEARRKIKTVLWMGVSTTSKKNRYITIRVAQHATLLSDVFIASERNILPLLNIDLTSSFLFSKIKFRLMYL